MSDWEGMADLRGELSSINKNLSRIAQCLESAPFPEICKALERLSERFNDVTCPPGRDRDGFIMTKEERG
jgi:hypothetical protein